VLQQLLIGGGGVKQGTSLSLPGIAVGDCITALAGPAAQQLTRHLAVLVIPLAAFAVQLCKYLLVL